MRGFAKVGIEARKGRRRGLRASFTDIYFFFRVASKLYRFCFPKRRASNQPRVSEKSLRLETIARLREGIPPGDSFTIVCGRGTHRVVHDRSGVDITALIAFAAELPLARSGIAIHEYELMRAVINLLVGDHEVSFLR